MMKIPARSAVPNKHTNVLKIMPAPQRPDDRQARHFTFTTYGTWFHGDERGSWNRSGAYVKPDRGLERYERQQCKYDEVRLTTPMRRIVFDAICAEADFHQWKIYALNVLDNHVHLLIATPREIDPSVVLARVKSAATSALRKAGYFLDQKRIWTNKGNSKSIDTPGYFGRVYEYIVYKQKQSPFEIFGRRA